MPCGSAKWSQKAARDKTAWSVSAHFSIEVLTIFSRPWHPQAGRRFRYPIQDWLLPKGGKRGGENVPKSFENKVPPKSSLEGKTKRKLFTKKTVAEQYKESKGNSLSWVSLKGLNKNGYNFGGEYYLADNVEGSQN